ncbi:tetratricopeptide repeat protein [Phenylobacterium sp.]|uniref:tetratricopeptide repeat protein n=1 Tax=Phenylobacterium sp. TaxID=1871053 RepID=UPI002ED907C8
MRDRAIALYGRFSHGERERLGEAIERAGGLVARDLTRRSDVFVVGALATALIDSGALSERIQAARARGVPVLGERAFAVLLGGEAAGPAATLPLTTALADTPLTAADAEVLAAFDLIGLDGDRCRFGDAQAIRTAADLMAHGRSLAETVRILARARDLAPRGRYRIVLTPAGDAALKWADGLTTLEGQGQLAFDEAHATVEDLFEAATVAEAEGDLEAAAHLYDLCARADRRDAIAPYNHGNIRLAQGAFDQARLAYQRALARDPKFIEARYNLAQALDAAGRAEAASVELVRVLDADPRHSDAVFNLAQLRMKSGAIGEAKTLYERYLALDPPEDWARTARRALQVCSGLA